jgi:hypothetical protein
VEHFEFVPMISTLYALSQGFGIYVTARSRALLGMNEPSARNNQSAPAVAARWSEMEAVANRFSPPLRLISPAPGGLELKHGERWLHDFFQACASLPHGCRVDALAVHFYECDGSNETSAAAAASAMMSFLERVHKRYKVPLWLTEFKCGRGRPNARRRLLPQRLFG